MIRLKSIHIKGFKDPSYEKHLEFSSEPITVIYGENGSGKTTLLKILFAVLSRDEKTLLQENVMEVQLVYERDSVVKDFVIKRNEVDSNFIWQLDDFDILNTSSILFGVHRGVVQENEIRPMLDKRKLSSFIFDLIEEMEKVAHISQLKNFLNEVIMVSRSVLSSTSKQGLGTLLSLLDVLLNSGEIRLGNVHDKVLKLKSETHYLLTSKTYTEENNFIKQLDNQPHISTDFVKIKDIQSSIINQYNKGQKILSDKIQKAFFETIEKAVIIDETNEDFNLPDGFDQRIKEHKEFIISAIPAEKSPLTERIKAYLETGDKSLTEKSKIFRAMLLNVVESAEEENPTLESIATLIKIFNEHLYNHKKLVVDGENAYILLENGKIHALSELSSGERNILSILTLFLIIGSERNFLMIDEPEISLNIKWQRKFLPLLSKLNSKAQIIVASHSPSIAHQNSKYLVELI